MTSPSTPNLRIAGAVVLALAVAHLAYSWWGNTPGYLTYDSGTYHIMVKTFAETGSFLVDNWYDVVASEELVVGQLRAPDGRLVAQYPELFTLLALPFYLAFGWHGVFLLEAFAWLGILALIFRLATLLFEDRGVALAAVAIYGLATFSWEYSQSSYPHLLATLLVLGAFDAVMRARHGASNGPSLWSLAGGLLAGMAIGVRLDSLFALPGLCLPFLLTRPIGWSQLVALGVGTTPALAFLSVTNQLKFGTWNPISYGATGGSGFISDWRWYVPAFIAGLAVLLAVLAWSRRDAWWPTACRRVSTRMVLVTAATVFAGLVVLAPESVGRVLHGTFQIVVDMRSRPAIEEPALIRSDGGAMVYLNGVKKSLLQSCPYLVLLVVPIVAARRSATAHRAELWALMPIPLAYIGIYGSLAWHGSIALNMRYLNPILPFTSLLMAWTWSRLTNRPSFRTAATTVGTTGAVLVYTFAGGHSLFVQERLFLDLSLVLALALLVAERLARNPTSSRWQAMASRGLPILLLIAFVYSGAVVVTQDYPTSHSHRAQFLRHAQGIAPLVDEHSILFVDSIDMAWGLLDRVDDLYLARPEEDDSQTFVPMVRFALGHERKVYYVLTDEVYEVKTAELRKHGIVPRSEPAPVGADIHGTWYLIELVAATP